MEIIWQTWKDVAGLRQKGVQVRKGETIVVDELKKNSIFQPMCVQSR